MLYIISNYSDEDNNLMLEDIIDFVGNAYSSFDSNGDLIWDSLLMLVSGVTNNFVGASSNTTDESGDVFEQVKLLEMLVSTAHKFTEWWLSCTTVTGREV